MHFEWLDIALIGGVPAAAILIVMLAFKLTKGRPAGKVTFGPVSGLALAAVILVFCAGITKVFWSAPFTFPYGVLFAGQMIQVVADRMRSAALGRVLSAIGLVLQGAIVIVFAYLFFSVDSIERFGAIAAPVVLAIACLAVLLTRPSAPAWRTVGFPAAFAAVLAVVVTVASGANWLMTLLWLGAASGPVAVAWLRASAADPHLNDTTPQAMEPTA